MISPPHFLLGRHRLRSCFSCGEPLEEHGRELQPNTMVPCAWCARLYVAGEPGELIALVVDEQPADVQVVFRDFLAAVWRSRDFIPPAPAGQLERSAA